MNVQRFESVFIETSQEPTTHLPDDFQAALSEIEQNRDNAACWRCGDLVGWVFMEGPVTGRLEWVPVGLVRLVSEDAPPTHQDPIRPMCETCAPYVDPFSYREMMRTRRADREAVRAAEEKRDG